VYHGLPRNLLPFNPTPSGGYFAFLGRISPEKRPDLAIEIAVRAGARLKIAAKVDRSDQAYWKNVNKPMIDSSPNVEFVGEIGERDKGEFLGNADALLFPIVWPEPFGLVMIEAMACGTPVIAFRRGSAPEVIDDGVSGFLSTMSPKPPWLPGGSLSLIDRTRARLSNVASTLNERLANMCKIYRGLVRAEDNRRNGKRNGVTQSLIPPAQRGYQPILAELGAEVPNAAQVD
jgi:glycosyltransferase involved in cell wall biosynthesis